MTDAPPEIPGVTQVVHLTEGAKNVVDSYSRFYNSFSEEKRREREENSRQITESFYELVTDFYEFGYGQSFHFGPIFEGHSNDECLIRYQREIARALNVKPGDRVLVSPRCMRVTVRLHDFLHSTHKHCCYEAANACTNSLPNARVLHMRCIQVLGRLSSMQ